jgi:hypothetical protein
VIKRSLKAMRTVHQGDALDWLKEQGRIPKASFITSLPDYSEFPNLALSEWESWFAGAASLVMESICDEGVAIFYQTDLKHAGVWVDKSRLCHLAAERAGLSLLWHKIVCRVPAGTPTFGRPGYSHLLCYSRGLRADPAHGSADVLPSAGETTWTRGMGLDACAFACRYVRDRTPTRTVIDPFCGHGTVLAVANELGLEAVGVELGGKRAKIARTLQSVGGRLVRPGSRE